LEDLDKAEFKIIELKKDLAAALEREKQNASQNKEA
jgi:hypothetical protein